MKYSLFIILAVFFVSFASIFVKLTEVEISVIAMYRLGIGGLILFPFTLKNNYFSKLKFKDLKLIFLGGFVISLHFLFWFTSLRYTSATSSTLIICTQPLVTLAFGYALYREKITVKQFIVLLIALLGVSIVAWGDIYLSKEALIGDALTFVAVIFFVIYLYIGRSVVKKHSFIIYTSILFLSASLILLVYNIIMGYEMMNLPLRDWIILLLMAIIPNAGQVIFNFSLRYVKSSLIATIILLEPIFATILAVIILKDSVYIYHYIGGIIIIVSIYIYIKLHNIEEKKFEVE